MKKYYYDFGYFFSNKDSGSLRVTTTEPLDTDDTDECVEYALKHNLIDEEYAGNIIYVEPLTKEDARDMGFDVDDDEQSVWYRKIIGESNKKVTKHTEITICAI